MQNGSAPFAQANNREQIYLFFAENPIATNGFIHRFSTIPPFRKLRHHLCKGTSPYNFGAFTRLFAAGQRILRYCLQACARAFPTRGRPTIRSNSPAEKPEPSRPTCKLLYRYTTHDNRSVTVSPVSVIQLTHTAPPDLTPRPISRKAVGHWPWSRPPPQRDRAP